MQCTTTSQFFLIKNTIIIILSDTLFLRIPKIIQKLTFWFNKLYITCSYFKSQCRVVSSSRLSGHFTHPPPGWVTKLFSIIVLLQPLLKHIHEATIGISWIIFPCRLNDSFRQPKLYSQRFPSVLDISKCSEYIWKVMRSCVW